MKQLIFASLLAFLAISWIMPHKLRAQDIAAIEKDSVASWENLSAPPSYPGGMDAFNRFLFRNIRYPNEAAEKNIQGTVHISFIIEKDGSTSHYRIDKAGGSGLDEEAIRVLKRSSKWSPALIDGKPVRVRYVASVRFSLAED